MWLKRANVGFGEIINPIDYKISMFNFRFFDFLIFKGDDKPKPTILQMQIL